MDNDKQAENKRATTAPDTSPVSESVEVDTSPKESIPPEAEIKSFEGVSQDKGQKESQEEKPSRLEKRVKQLSEKKSKIEETLRKLADKTGFQATLPSYQASQEESLIRPEDYEQGIAPEELEARIRAQREADAERVKNEIRAELEYKNNVQEHINDIETLKNAPEFQEGGEDYDPEFMEFVTQQYQVLNNFVDPVSGATIFVPRVKMSDIYKQYKPMIEKWKEKGGIKSMAKTIEDISSSAVAPTTGKGSEVSLEDLRKDLWRNPGKVAEYLEKKLL